ncbi:uncharacterized protein LOC135831006 [Sycon ciliatum]|uniref:uncharacterized protein LOC135831006 n=1 Tax=Sycon ciliatum TaxID=27933 RepID=UPI0020A8FC13|eukprot:scpid99435/ scgid15901/ 
MALNLLRGAARSSARLGMMRSAGASVRTYYDPRFPFVHPENPKSAVDVAFVHDFPDRTVMCILDTNWEKLPSSEQEKVKPMLDDGRLYILRDDVYNYKPLPRHFFPGFVALQLLACFVIMFGFPLYVVKHFDKHRVPNDME